MILEPDHGAHGFPDPAKLPASPAALLAALDRAARRSHWDTGAVELGGTGFFTSEQSRSWIMSGLIERLLQVPIRPALRAALFEVTGRLPGITLDRHATDLIGRPGVGISLSLPAKGHSAGLGLDSWSMRRAISSSAS